MSKDLSKIKPGCKLPNNEKIIGEDADRKMANDRTVEFKKLFKTT